MCLCLCALVCIGLCWYVMHCVVNDVFVVLLVASVLASMRANQSHSPSPKIQRCNQIRGARPSSNFDTGVMSNDIPYQLSPNSWSWARASLNNLAPTGTPDTAQARTKTRRSVVYERVLSQNGYRRLLCLL